MRRCVCGRDGVFAARPQARLPRPQPDDSAERDRTQSIGGGLPKDENRSPGALPGVPKQLLSPNRCGFAAARGWPDTYLPVPRQARIRAVWGQCWCVPGRAPSRSMPSEGRRPPADSVEVPNIQVKYVFPMGVGHSLFRIDIRGQNNLFFIAVVGL